MDNLEVKYCYDRKRGRATSFSIPLNDITEVKRIGRSVVIYYDKSESYSSHRSDQQAEVGAVERAMCIVPARLEPHLEAS